MFPDEDKSYISSNLRFSPYSLVSYDLQTTCTIYIYDNRWMSMAPVPRLAHGTESATAALILTLDCLISLLKRGLVLWALYSSF